MMEGSPQQQHQQPDHAGLQVIDHGGLEVVPQSDLPEITPQQQQQQQQQQNQQDQQQGHGFEQQNQWEKAGYNAVGYSSTGYVPSAGYTPLVGGQDPNTPGIYTPMTGLDQTAPGYGFPPYEATMGPMPPPPPPPIIPGVAPAVDPRQRRICGVKRTAFFIVVALASFMLIMGVALGVGLGIGLRKDKDASSPQTTPAPSNTTTPTPYVTGTNTLPAPTATATATANVDIICPANNQTLYHTDPGTGGGGGASNKTYLLLCGRDYSSSGGAADLFHQQTDSMVDCIAACAQNSACTGAGWGNYQGQNVCWLKSAIGKPNNAPGWYFAIEESGDNL